MTDEHRVPVDDPDALRRILATTEALLLDFDGPVCSVFTGIPASVVADQLRQVLADGGSVMRISRARVPYSNLSERT